MEGRVIVLSYITQMVNKFWCVRSINVKKAVLDIGA